MSRIKYFMLIGCILMIFSGCQNIVQSSKPSQTEGKNKKKQVEAAFHLSVNNSSLAKAENKLVKAVPSNTIDSKKMTKLSEFSYDLDLDNVEEKIELSTAAERNKKGQMMWDDGQNWRLLVRDGNKSYPLLAEYVQLGSVYFSISNDAVGEISNVNIMINTGTGLVLKTYKFSKEKNGFVGGTVYKSKETNFVYSSIPSY